jgi:hypothetical protein
MEMVALETLEGEDIVHLRRLIKIILLYTSIH